MVFFTPRSGLATVLNIGSDFSGTSVQTTITVEHYGILEGQDLTIYLIVQSIVVVNLVRTILPPEIVLIYIYIYIYIHIYIYIYIYIYPHCPCELHALVNMYIQLFWKKSCSR